MTGTRKTQENQPERIEGIRRTEILAVYIG